MYSKSLNFTSDDEPDPTQRNWLPKTRDWVLVALIHRPILDGEGLTGLKLVSSYVM